MGGHGGLNILPQKKWNVYNYDNRDIVQKDKKQHAQKTRKKYQSERKHTMQQKFDVLKGQESIVQRKEQNLKQSYKKDSILNNQFKRLAQENKHVNLFQQEQKIIENREVLQFHKIKQAQWLKDKNIDYSSKFLGTYNDDAKMPWYAKFKGLIPTDEKKQQKKMKKQRYDMQDLTDKIRLQKIENKKRMYFGQNQSKTQYSSRFNDNTISTIKRNLGQNKVKRQFNNQRQRSRNKKYEFIKQRQTISNKNQKDEENSKEYSEKINSIQQKSQITQKIPNQLPQKQIESKQNSDQNNKNDQLQILRQKRLKRQQKQRKKAQQLRKKLQQAINRN